MNTTPTRTKKPIESPPAKPSSSSPPTQATEESEMQTLYVTTAGAIANRSRAGLRFTRGEHRTVHVVDAPDDVIAARRAAGEAVVTRAGAALLLGDEGLVVTDQPPPKPIPRAELKAPAPAPTPRVWNTIAAILGLVLSPVRALAWLALHAALEQRAASEPNPITARLWRRIDTRAAAGVDDPELLRLLAGVGTDVALPELPPATRRPFASFVWADHWMARIATLIGRAFPNAFDESAFLDERDHVRELHAEAQLRGVADAAMSAAACAGRGYVFAPLPDADHEHKLDEWLAKHEAAILERQREAHAQWMREVDDVRLAVVAAVDHAITTATGAPPLVRLALHELARDGRGMSTTPALTLGEAVDLALAHVHFVPVEVADSSGRVRLMVNTKKGIKHRRRGGLAFGPEPTVVDVDEATAELITGDDALVAVLVADDYEADAFAKLEATAADLEAKLTAKKEALNTEIDARAAEIEARNAQIAKLEGKVAELEGKVAAGAASDGSRERTGNRSKSHGGAA